MGVVRSFRELNVYQLSRDGAQRIFNLSKKFPIEERYSLTDQIRRCSRAVKAMIAEAWARRRYKAVFINKLDEALGEATETNHGWTMHATRSTCQMTNSTKLTRI